MPSDEDSRPLVDGSLRLEPIFGFRYRLTRPVPHEDGHFVEVARGSWEIVDQPIVQVHVSTTLPGRTRACALHPATTDRLFVASGLVRIVCFDGRVESPTFGRVNEPTLSERSPGLVVVPPNVYHGWRNIGDDEAVVINMPTSPYDYDRPDSLDLPWDSTAAREIIPYRW